jgi:hypothetical protein
MSVYFIVNSAAEVVKIGFSHDPESRRRDLQCGSVDPLHLLRVVDGGPKIEAWLHKRFSHLRISGEWFHFNPEMLTVVVPEEVPVRRAPQEGAPSSVREYIWEVDRLGLLTDEMRQRWTPFLEARK